MGKTSAAPAQQFVASVLADDLATVENLLRGEYSLREAVSGHGFKWGMPAIAAAKSREMVDLLVGHGAEIDAVSEWWRGGFGAREMERRTADYLLRLGAKLSPHAAAGLGFVEALAEMLEADPSLVGEKVGDGCEPLHFASSVGVAELLLARGAAIDARDDDHRSTPAQWLLKSAPEVTRFLIERGATTDLFMAVGLGDLELAAQLIADDPACTTHRIGHNAGPFPGISFEGRGGTIYQWTLGFNLSPHEVALKHDHTDVYDLLMKHTPPLHQLMVACTSANRELAESIAARHPGIVDGLSDDDKTLVAKFCWETNIDIEAVRLMLDMGFPIDVPDTNHCYSALHNAGWCGHLELVKLLLERGHPVDLVMPEFNATALGATIHSCIEAKRHPDGQFPEVVRLMLEAGVPFDREQYPVGHDGIDAVLQEFS